MTISSFFLFLLLLDRSTMQARWFFESLTSRFHQCLLLQPSRGQHPGRSSRRTILSPQTNPDSEVVLFCPLKGGWVRRRRSEESRQQSLWLIYKSFSSFLCPYTPFFFCCFCSVGWLVVTGNCPPPGHYSLDTSRPAVWCLPESHLRAWQKWSCWIPSRWRSLQTSESCRRHK